MRLMPDKAIKKQINQVNAFLSETKFGTARKYLRRLILQSTPLKFKKFRDDFAKICEQFPSGHREMLLKNIEEREVEIKREEKRKSEKKMRDNTPRVKIKFDSSTSEEEQDYGPGRCRYCGRSAMYASDVCYMHSRE